MPDNELKLRVSVETATVKELQEELKRLKTVFAEIRPDDPKFTEAQQSMALLDDRVKELTSGYKEFKQSQSEVKQAIEETSLSIEELGAKLAAGNIPTAERAALEKELTAAIRQTTTDEQLLAGVHAEEIKLVSQSKDIRAEANKELLSSNAKVKESYFINGDALRKLALESGGYVTKLQAETLATNLSKEQNISLAQATEIVTQAIKEEGLAQQNLSGFIRQTRQENRLQNFILNETRGAITSLSSGVGMLSGQLGEQTVALKGIGTSLTSGINMFQGLDFTVRALGRSLGVTSANFAAMSLGIIGVVALATSIYSFFTDMTKKAEEASKKLHDDYLEILKIKKELGLAPEGTLLGELNRRVEEAQKNLDEYLETAKKPLTISIPADSEGGAVDVEVKVGIDETKKIELEKILLEAQKEYKDETVAAGKEVETFASKIVDLKHELKQLSDQKFLESLRLEVKTAGDGLEDLKKKLGRVGTSEQKEGEIVSQKDVNDAEVKYLELQKKLQSVEVKITEDKKKELKERLDAEKKYHDTLVELQKLGYENAVSLARNTTEKAIAEENLRDFTARQKLSKEKADALELAGIAKVSAADRLVIVFDFAKKSEILMADHALKMRQAERPLAKEVSVIKADTEMITQIELKKELGVVSRDEYIAELERLKHLAELQHDYSMALRITKLIQQSRTQGLDEMLIEKKGATFGKAAMIGVDILSAGFQRLGDTIASEFVDKIIGATSLFQQFIGEVIAGIIRIAEQIATSAIISGLLSLIPGVGTFGSLFSKMSPIPFAGGGVIPEPVTGIGMRSGRSYTFAENMPERVSPLTSFGQSSQPMMIKIEGNFRSSGRDLISTFKLARIIDRKAGGNV